MEDLFKLSQPSPEEVQRLLESFGRNWPALLASITALSFGIWLIFDDYKDYGKVDRPTHHVYTGFIPFAGGLLGLGFTCFQILADAYPALRPATKSMDDAKYYSRTILEAMK